LGSEFTSNTYKYAEKPIFRVPISTPAVYPWPGDKRFDHCRKNFLWFNSNGFVHKGLDLVLEAFAGMPEFHLTVCGPIKDEVEKPFEKAFYKELYHTPNIHTAGWVEDASVEFLQIANSCSGVIGASCSEGGGGSIISCMQAGLIPIVNYESSVEIGSFGILLPDCSVESIRHCVRSFASLSADVLQEKAKRAWEFASTNHSRQRFTDEYKKVAKAIITTFCPPPVWKSEFSSLDPVESNA
jgi:glycosyltransferase involved in cell wall biosynthesis